MFCLRRLSRSVVLDAFALTLSQAKVRDNARIALSQATE